MRSGLPIDEALPALACALAASRSAVLQAPPGAGKSTVIPLFLLEQPWCAGKRIVMLEPRRLAARAVAQRMARTLQESIGRTVGYRMRMDTRVSAETRIEVVTEGVLTRMLQTDPALEGVAAVLFDEFHERSLQADLGLALVLDARSNLSPELRIVIMSATLDGVAAARLLDDAPVVRAPGRMFPITDRFVGNGAPLLPEAGPGPRDAVEKAVAHAVLRALSQERGDALVFLPGAREIRRVQSLLEAADLGPSVRVLPLFGELSGEEQDAALAGPTRGMRKVILATNIAETSLTIDGVRLVIDCGLVRRSLFDPATGMSRLETQRISRASAEQRRGRAGRLEPGICYRLWSEAAQRSLAPFTPPEIVEADLAPLALELAKWGVRDAAQLRWLDEPPAALLGSARDLLAALGALDPTGRITTHGDRMAQLGIHPRLAHMLLGAASLRAVPLAAELAALLSERDLLRGSAGSRDPDIRTRVDVIRSREAPPGVDRSGWQRARRIAQELVRRVPAADRDPRPSSDGKDDPDVGLVLAFAYPDRIGRRRPGAQARYTLANGRGAHFGEESYLGRQEFIVAVDLDDLERDARIRLAAPLAQADIEAHLGDRLEHMDSVEWSSREQAVIARHSVRLGAIVLEEKPLQEVPVEQLRAAMLEGIRDLGIEALPWTRAARELQARMEFVRQLAGPGHTPPASAAAADVGPERDAAAAWPAWPDVSDASLAGSTQVWLAPWLDGATRREHLSRLSMLEILQSLLSWQQQRRLDELAPSHLAVPSGSRIPIDYLDESAPAVSVRLQEVFGLDATPRIGDGRVPITFKLLSPARRPVQVTRDLASFWRGAYAEVRKDLRGRYPKHYWPEDPLVAQATRGVRRRT